MSEIFAKIRIDFLFSHPFLAVLALSIPTHYSNDEREAFVTDGYSIVIDEQKIDNYTKEELKYLYAHVLLHIILKHAKRGLDKQREIWNQACDIVANLILAEFNNIGTMPKDEVYEPKFRHMIVEQVYEHLLVDDNGGESFKLDLNPSNAEAEIEEDLDGIIIQALQSAKSYSYIKAFSMEINEILRPEIDLYSILKEYLHMSWFQKRLDYSTPNRRFIHKGVYMPGTKKEKDAIKLFIALDMSASISHESYKNFLGAIKSIVSDFNEFYITILPFDATVRVDLIKRLDSMTSINDDDILIPKTDGGTNFNAVLNYLESNESIDNESVLIVLSDGIFDKPKRIPLESVFLLTENVEQFEEYGKVIRI
ncbi:MAG: hypothetical protein RL154_1143 [Pseudomonadota bacterium]